MQSVITVGTVILGALALFWVGFWAAGIVESMRQDRQQTLPRSLISLLEVRGFSATTIVMAAPFLSLLLISLTHTRPDTTLEGLILQATLILFGGCAVLWLLTLYLRFRARRLCCKKES